MELTILGCNGPYCEIDGATAGYLVTTETGSILLDAGSGTFARLQKLTEPKTISAVVLSHLHHDHISDLGVFNYYLELLTKLGEFQGKMPCYCPREKGGVLPFEQLGSVYSYFDFIPVEEGRVFSIGGAEAEFKRLRHAAPDYGIRLTEKITGKKLVYSGDTNVCDGLEWLLSDCDLWLGGAPFIGGEYPPDGGHLSVEIMVELAKKYNVPTILSHLCPKHTPQQYEQAITDERGVLARPFGFYKL